MKKEYDLKNMKKRSGRVKVDKSASKVPISLRLDGGILSSLKDEAAKKGLPYQTLISSILFQYASGEFIEKSLVDLINETKAS